MRRKAHICRAATNASMKVPPKRKGNDETDYDALFSISASMKVPPKRKGNGAFYSQRGENAGLNESPSEKEGKSPNVREGGRGYFAPQ